MKRYTIIANDFKADFCVKNKVVCCTSPNICRFTGKTPSKLFDWLDDKYTDSYHITPTEVSEQI